MPHITSTQRNLLRFVISIAGLLLLLSGCAINRGILDIQVAVPKNSASDKAVKIVRVTDQRQFEMRPKVASIPSLKGGEIDNKAIKLRAIARKRNSFGQAIGDILLPEGRTVEDLVQEALTRSFREAGYRVIDDTSLSAESATPVEADIKQFWAWFTPGFFAVTLEFEAKVKIKGEIQPFRDGQTIRGYVKLHSQGAGTRAWRNTLNKGIDAFVQECTQILKEP